MRKFKGTAGTEITIGVVSSVTLADGTIKEYTNPVEAKERFINEDARIKDKAITAAIAEEGYNVWTGERVSYE